MSDLIIDLYLFVLGKSHNSFLHAYVYMTSFAKSSRSSQKGIPQNLMIGYLVKLWKVVGNFLSASFLSFMEFTYVFDFLSTWIKLFLLLHKFY